MTLWRMAFSKKDFKQNDTQNRGIEKNDIQRNGFEKNDIQLNDFKNNYILYNGKQQNDSRHMTLSLITFADQHWP